MASQNSETHVKASHGGILVRPEHAQDVTEAWFDPHYWQGLARPVSEGGRGSAWFVDTPEGNAWVLRHYRRGGAVARLSEEAYVYQGETSVRSVAEFRLTNELWAWGLPVPPPVAAWFERHGLLYRARIIVQRLPEAVPMASLMSTAGGDLWEAVGRMIRRFHDAGLDHADLNAHNILVTEGGCYLIDFDRSRLRARPGRWQQRNLARLRRSVDKLWTTPSDVEVKEAGWRALIKGYGIKD